MKLLGALLFLAIAAAPRPVAASTFDEQCRAAMAPYYASLLTSGRNDADGTLRHLIVLRGRWATLQQIPASERPRWAQGVPELITSRIEAARARTVARNMVGAHAELESIRSLLRDARARAGIRTFDDALTDYHEAMERLTGRAGLHNEIALNADDYAAIQSHVARAAAVWTEMQASAGSANNARAWPRIVDATVQDLSRLRAATSAKDMAATQVAAEELKARYFELLAVLARG